MGKRDKMVACLICGSEKRQDSMLRHMRSHTTHRVRIQGKFAKSKDLKVPRVAKIISHPIEDVPRVVKRVTRMVKDVPRLA